MVHATVGMGRTLGMALDRQFMSYQLDPTAAVAYLMSSSGGWDSRGEIVPASGTTAPAAFQPFCKHTPYTQRNKQLPQSSSGIEQVFMEWHKYPGSLLIPVGTIGC